MNNNQLFSITNFVAATLVLAIAMNSGIANAATVYAQCIGDANGVMPDMIDCSADEANRQDIRLNKAYKIAMSKTADKNKLKIRQRAWIKERDKTCKLDDEGGQAAMLDHYECIASKTADRASELEAIK
jgi:uncharacterized protein YecT (DUF1311 family)